MFQFDDTGNRRKFEADAAEGARRAMAQGMGRIAPIDFAVKTARAAGERRGCQGDLKIWVMDSSIPSAGLYDELSMELFSPNPDARIYVLDATNQGGGVALYGREDEVKEGRPPFAFMYVARLPTPSAEELKEIAARNVRNEAEAAARERTFQEDMRLNGNFGIGINNRRAA